MSARSAWFGSICSHFAFLDFDRREMIESLSWKIRLIVTFVCAARVLSWYWSIPTHFRAVSLNVNFQFDFFSLSGVCHASLLLHKSAFALSADVFCSLYILQTPQRPPNKLFLLPFRQPISLLCVPGKTEFFLFFSMPANWLWWLLCSSTAAAAADFMLKISPLNVQIIIIFIRRLQLASNSLRVLLFLSLLKTKKKE